MVEEPGGLAFTEAVAEWGDLGIEQDAFARFVEARRRDGGAKPEHEVDLYLACALSVGNERALLAFESKVLPEVEAAVRRVDAAPSFLGEIRQALRVHLFVREAERPARIENYRGTGPLLAWVRAAALRLAQNAKRGERPTVSKDEILSELVASEPDPELRHLKTLYRSEFARALRGAFAGLPERQRLILRLHYLDGLRLKPIARLYSVDESTVSRWLKSAQAAVADAAYQTLSRELSLPKDRLESVARMVQSQLELSLSRLLRP